MISGRNSKKTVNKSNVNKVLASARKAVAEGRAREEILQMQLDESLKKNAELKKSFEDQKNASAKSHKNEKSQLESSIREEKAAVERSLKEEKAALEKALREEKAAVERSLKEEKAALEKALISEKEALERSLKEENAKLANELKLANDSNSKKNAAFVSKNNSLQEKCAELNKKVKSLEKKYAKEMRSRISSERDLNILKKRLLAEEKEELPEKAKPGRKNVFSNDKRPPTRKLSIDKITEKETRVLVTQNKPKSSLKKIRFGF